MTSKHLATPIYYLPGYGGRLQTGLGEGLRGRGFDVVGREIFGVFKSLSFSQQVALIAQDLATNHWHEDALVVANSYGAYLFLHAQARLPPFPGQVLLLSPIVGEFSNNQTHVGFIPSQAGMLLEVAASGRYPVPLHCEIHVGELDWQSNPSDVSELAGHMGLSVTSVPDTGHVLSKDYVSEILNRWLTPQH